MAITVYEVDKHGKHICTRSGDENIIIASIEASNNTFTLTPPATKDGKYKWVNSEWVIDSEAAAKLKIKNQNDVWNSIKDRRLQAIVSGVYVASVGKWFHTDEVTMATYAHLGNLITLGIFQDTDWKVMDNTFITLTQEIYKELQIAIYKQSQHNYQVAEEHKVKMLLMDAPLDYDYSSGWSDVSPT